MGAAGKALKTSPVISVRQMRPRDIPAALAILYESPDAAMWSESGLLESCVSGNGWVAEVGRRLAGILIAQAAADELEILNLAVATGERRKGIASHLVNSRLQRAHAEGVRATYLELRASNAAALAFYRSLGFQICGRRTGYYRDPAEDAMLMALHSPGRNY